MDPEAFTAEFTRLCKRLAQLGDHWVHDQPPTVEDLDRLEHALGGRLPASYRTFLLVYGGGSLPSRHLNLCSVRRGDPLAAEEGQVYGQTLLNRAYHALPLGLVVIEQQARNGRCVCVTATSPGDGPVLSYLLDEHGSEVRADDFASWLLARCQAFVQIGERAQRGKDS